MIADSFNVISCVFTDKNEKLFPKSSTVQLKMDLHSKCSSVYQKYINSCQGSGDDIGLMWRIVNYAHRLEDFRLLIVKFREFREVQC